MKEPAYGPTEILRLANGGVTIVTKSWWKKFLAMQLASFSRPSPRPTSSFVDSPPCGLPANS